MKKKFLALSLIICLGFVGFSLTGCFGPVVKQFEIEYTNNMQFFVGEDYHDELLKGTAIYSDDTEKDVTEEMEVDASAYNKTQEGKYDIVCKYEGIEVDYEVEVVDVMTDLYSIATRTDPLFANAFKAVDGALNFSASYIELVDSANELYLKQTLSYHLEDGVLKQYYVLQYVDSTGLNVVNAFESLYVGNATVGTVTDRVLTSDDTINFYHKVTSRQDSLNGYKTACRNIAVTKGASIFLDSEEWINFSSQTYPHLEVESLVKVSEMYCLNLSNGASIYIDSDGCMHECAGVEFDYDVSIPTELTA